MQLMPNMNRGGARYEQPFKTTPLHAPATPKANRAIRLTPSQSQGIGKSAGEIAGGDYINSAIRDEKGLTGQLT